VTAEHREPDRYDLLGVGYQRVRHEDARLARRIHAALGPAQTVLNVGAGTGNYEPPGRMVVAVEPSAMMITQRASRAVPVVRATAEALPFGGYCFDAALALWTIHHWTDPDRGIAELRRVARRVVAVVASEQLAQLWLIRDYFPAIAKRLRPDIQPERLLALLGEGTIDPLLVPRDCEDGFAEAFWARPEAYLDPTIRAGMSAFRLLDQAQVSAGVRRLRADLLSGLWDARNGSLRHLEELDCGLRLITATSTTV